MKRVLAALLSLSFIWTSSSLAEATLSAGSAPLQHTYSLSTLRIGSEALSIPGVSGQRINRRAAIVAVALLHLITLGAALGAWAQSPQARKSQPTAHERKETPRQRLTRLLIDYEKADWDWRAANTQDNRLNTENIGTTWNVRHTAEAAVWEYVKTPSGLNALRSLAKDPKAPPNLRKLAQDFLTEQSREHLTRLLHDFEVAQEEHQRGAGQGKFYKALAAVNIYIRTPEGRKALRELLDDQNADPKVQALAKPFAAVAPPKKAPPSHRGSHGFNVIELLTILSGSMFMGAGIVALLAKDAVTLGSLASLPGAAILGGAALAAFGVISVAISVRARANAKNVPPAGPAFSDDPKLIDIEVLQIIVDSSGRLYPAHLYRVRDVAKNRGITDDQVTAALGRLKQKQWISVYGQYWEKVSLTEAGMQAVVFAKTDSVIAEYERQYRLEKVPADRQGKWSGPGTVLGAIVLSLMAALGLGAIGTRAQTVPPPAPPQTQQQKAPSAGEVKVIIDSPKLLNRTRTGFNVVLGLFHVNANDLHNSRFFPPLESYMYNKLRLSVSPELAQAKARAFIDIQSFGGNVGELSEKTDDVVGTVGDDGVLELSLSDFEQEVLARGNIGISRRQQDQDVLGSNEHQNFEYMVQINIDLTPLSMPTDKKKEKELRHGKLEGVMKTGVVISPESLVLPFPIATPASAQPSQPRENTRIDEIMQREFGGPKLLDRILNSRALKVLGVGAAVMMTGAWGQASQEIFGTGLAILVFAAIVIWMVKPWARRNTDGQPRDRRSERGSTLADLLTIFGGAMLMGIGGAVLHAKGALTLGSLLSLEGATLLIGLALVAYGVTFIAIAIRARARRKREAQARQAIAASPARDLPLVIGFNPAYPVARQIREEINQITGQVDRPAAGPPSHSVKEEDRAPSNAGSLGQPPAIPKVEATSIQDAESSSQTPDLLAGVLMMLLGSAFTVAGGLMLWVTSIITTLPLTLKGAAGPILLIAIGIPITILGNYMIRTNRRARRTDTLETEILKVLSDLGGDALGPVSIRGVRKVIEDRVTTSQLLQYPGKLSSLKRKGYVTFGPQKGFIGLTLAGRRALDEAEKEHQKALQANRAAIQSLAVGAPPLVARFIPAGFGDEAMNTYWKIHDEITQLTGRATRSLWVMSGLAIGLGVIGIVLAANGVAWISMLWPVLLLIGGVAGLIASVVTSVSKARVRRTLGALARQERPDLNPTVGAQEFYRTGHTRDEDVRVRAAKEPKYRSAAGQSENAGSLGQPDDNATLRNEVLGALARADYAVAGQMLVSDYTRPLREWAKIGTPIPEWELKTVHVGDIVLLVNDDGVLIEMGELGPVYEYDFANPNQYEIKGGTHKTEVRLNDFHVFRLATASEFEELKRQSAAGQQGKRRDPGTILGAIVLSLLATLGAASDLLGAVSSIATSPTSHPIHFFAFLAVGSLAGLITYPMAARRDSPFFRYTAKSIWFVLTIEPLLDAGNFWFGMIQAFAVLVGIAAVVLTGAGIKAYRARARRTAAAQPRDIREVYANLLGRVNELVKRGEILPHYLVGLQDLEGLLDNAPVQQRIESLARMTDDELVNEYNRLNNKLIHDIFGQSPAAGQEDFAIRVLKYLRSEGGVRKQASLLPLIEQFKKGSKEYEPFHNAIEELERKRWIAPVRYEGVIVRIKPAGEAALDREAATEPSGLVPPSEKALYDFLVHTWVLDPEKAEQLRIAMDDPGPNQTFLLPVSSDKYSALIPLAIVYDDPIALLRDLVSQIDEHKGTSEYREMRPEVLLKRLQQWESNPLPASQPSVDPQGPSPAHSHPADRAVNAAA